VFPSTVASTLPDANRAVKTLITGLPAGAQAWFEANSMVFPWTTP
jgi:hypothetical protein